MTLMEVTAQRIFIGDKNEVPIVCRQCGAHKTVNESQIKGYGKPLRVKCRCGSIFNVVFEKRTYYRKETDLLGVCYRSGSDEPWSNITVSNLSKTGIGFTLDSKGVRDSDIREGNILRIQFTLDDRERSVVRIKVIVRSIGDKRVGGELYQPEQHTMKQLGFYLTP
jgi:hypothetical protein